MAYIVNGKRQLDLPGPGVSFNYENSCRRISGHKHGEIVCESCGRDYCYACCDHTDIDDQIVLICPECNTQFKR